MVHFAFCVEKRGTDNTTTALPEVLTVTGEASIAEQRVTRVVVVTVTIAARIPLQVCYGSSLRLESGLSLP